MLTVGAWMLIGLGIAHVLFGLVRFRGPLGAILADGFIGAFMPDDSRRLAFWFVIAGPLLTLLGQVALRAIAIGDRGLLRTIGWYLAGTFVVGVLAFPKSPLWALLPPAILFVCAGQRWLA